MAAATEQGEEVDSLLNDFFDVFPEPPDHRESCTECSRPKSVCWCPYLPHPPLDVSTTIIILQHPFEEKRCLRTAPMIKCSLEKGRCHILKGRRFNLDKHPVLRRIVDSDNTLLLFPGSDAVNLRTLPSGRGVVSSGYNLILLDGTWTQARGIYQHNPFLHKLKKVQLDAHGTSEYVIRTQPADICLSTVESAAITLAHLEADDKIQEALLKPLRALCSFQMQFGAVKHHSKQYLIENGLYVKQQSRPTQQLPSKKRSQHNPQTPQANNDHINREVPSEQFSSEEEDS